jgi:hypothetical protein
MVHHLQQTLNVGKGSEMGAADFLYLGLRNAKPGNGRSHRDNPGRIVASDFNHTFSWSCEIERTTKPQLRIKNEELRIFFYILHP